MNRQSRADLIEELTIRRARLRSRFRDLRTAFGYRTLGLTDIDEQLAEVEDELRRLKEPVRSEA